jgi:hypothetical protein
LRAGATNTGTAARSPAVNRGTLSGVKRLTYGIVAAAALALAGCGSSATTTVTVPVSSDSSTATTAGFTTITSAPSTTTSTPTTATVQSSSSAARTATVALATFRSPSSNIGCDLIAGEARCDIRRRSWAPPRTPASCPPEVDFGQGLEVGPSGRGTFVCAGDTALDPQAPALPYGVDSHVASFTCASRKLGITCTNRRGHGFFISAQFYRLF